MDMGEPFRLLYVGTTWRDWCEAMLWGMYVRIGLEMAPEQHIIVSVEGLRRLQSVDLDCKGQKFEAALLSGNVLSVGITDDRVVPAQYQERPVVGAIYTTAAFPEVWSGSEVLFQGFHIDEGPSIYLRPESVFEEQEIVACTAPDGTPYTVQVVSRKPLGLRVRIID